MVSCKEGILLVFLFFFFFILSVVKVDMERIQNYVNKK